MPYLMGKDTGKLLGAVFSNKSIKESNPSIAAESGKVGIGFCRAAWGINLIDSSQTEILRPGVGLDCLFKLAIF